MMMRLILISFGFLGWAFYEMSGGSEFDAEAIRAARLEAVEAERAAKLKPAKESKVVVVAEAPKVVVDTDPPSNQEVTRVSLNLTTLETVPTVQTAVAEAMADVDEAVPQNVSLEGENTQAIIPSLITPSDEPVQETLVAATTVFEDIRTVSGNRVNVRGGPGTSYGVVNKLVRGDAVKILEDGGNGWVRLQPVNGGPVGWMADFLLAGG